MNYQIKLKEIIDSLDSKKTLLLHSCCGPCSTAVITYLEKYFDITVIYYNPNIEPLKEYELRKSEQIRFLKEYNPTIKFIDSPYDNSIFHSTVRGLELEKEGGLRCPSCFKLRLEYTAKKAKEYHYDYFGTTLTVSPHKNSNQINQIGALLSSIYGVLYLYSDFKKNGGYQNSIEISKKYNLYRQDYCGCLYGRKND